MIAAIYARKSARRGGEIYQRSGPWWLDCAGQEGED
jgi:hypothetical protein